MLAMLLSWKKWLFIATVVVEAAYQVAKTLVGA